MARVRRKANARKLNLEIVGLASIGAAIIFGIALALPEHAGNIGRATAGGLRHLFGGAAPLFPVVVALLGAIVFLEINVPRMIAYFGSAALAYFLIVDAAFGAGGPARGGVVGGTIWWALASLLGGVGSWIVLGLGALALTLSLTQVSLKKIIGRVIALGSRARLPEMPKLSLRLPEGHSSLREAFSLPKAEPKPEPPKRPERAVFDNEIEDDESTAIVPVSAVFAPVAPPPAMVEFDDDEDVEETDAADRRPVVGEYESADLVAARPEPVEGRTYKLPDLSLFDPPQAQVTDDSNRAHVLEDTLASFGVGAKVDTERLLRAGTNLAYR